MCTNFTPRHTLNTIVFVQYNPGGGIDGNIYVGWTALYRSNGIKVSYFTWNLSVQKQCFTIKQKGYLYEATYFSGLDTAPVILENQ